MSAKTGDKAVAFLGMMVGLIALCLMIIFICMTIETARVHPQVVPEQPPEEVSNIRHRAILRNKLFYSKEIGWVYTDHELEWIIEGGDASLADKEVTIRELEAHADVLSE